MTKSFDRFINEVMGADSMERDPADLIISPDIQRASAMMNFSGTSGAIPTHWNNSPFLTGGRLVSAFGLNPKGATKKPVLTYHEFMKAAKGLSNK